MSTGIQVAVRCRPLRHGELSTISADKEEDGIRVRNPARKSSSLLFRFDQYYSESAAQDDIFKTTVFPRLGKVLDGFNVSVFAYGQTGSGKTHTMMGQGDDWQWYDWRQESAGTMPKSAGIIPRSLKYIAENMDASIGISMLEVYNEQIIDLLSARNDLQLREIKSGGWYVEGLVTLRVRSFEEMMLALNAGNNRRTIALTMMNAESSRSHSVVIVRVEKEASQGRLHLVDLAGSERQGKSMSRDSAFREALHINTSLLMLGNVIESLTSGKRHVPYRNSVLTRLLQESLGGNTESMMIACVSPEESDFQETQATIQFASRAMGIEKKALVKNDSVNGVRISDNKKLVDEFRVLEREVVSKKLGVGFSYVGEKFLDDIRECEVACSSDVLPEAGNFYDLKERFWLRLKIDPEKSQEFRPHDKKAWDLYDSQHKVCPRDQRQGCSLVDALPHFHVGIAKFYLSWTWAITVVDFISAVRSWCGAKDMSSESLWVCFFCNNQHRHIVEESSKGSDELENEFFQRIRSIGNVLILLDGLGAPVYITRIWCVYELFQAVHMDIDVTMIMPQACECEMALEFDNKVAIDSLGKRVAAIDVRNATAYFKDDVDRIKAKIEISVGFDIVNKKARDYFKNWLVEQFSRQLTMAADRSNRYLEVPARSSSKSKVRQSPVCTPELVEKPLSRAPTYEDDFEGEDLEIPLSRAQTYEDDFEEEDLEIPLSRARTYEDDFHDETHDHLVVFLDKIGLGHHAAAFEAEELDLDALQALDREALNDLLKEMKMPIGARLKILRELKPVGKETYGSQD